MTTGFLVISDNGSWLCAVADLDAENFGLR